MTKLVNRVSRRPESSQSVDVEEFLAGKDQVKKPEPEVYDDEYDERFEREPESEDEDDEGEARQWVVYDDVELTERMLKLIRFLHDPCDCQYLTDEQIVGMIEGSLAMGGYAWRKKKRATKMKLMEALIA